LIAHSYSIPMPFNQLFGVAMFALRKFPRGVYTFLARYPALRADDSPLATNLAILKRCPHLGAQIPAVCGYFSSLIYTPHSWPSDRQLRMHASVPRVGGEQSIARAGQSILHCVSLAGGYVNFEIRPLTDVYQLSSGQFLFSTCSLAVSAPP